jgi:hypothetical protein
MALVAESRRRGPSQSRRGRSVRSGYAALEIATNDVNAASRLTPGAPVWSFDLTCNHKFV